MKAAVIQFPGSNCDRDMQVAIQQEMEAETILHWHADANLPMDLDFIAIPGGFSYGDYLRSGAMAARSPVMASVIKAADRGVPILGVCNGFQILTESGLLPGALMRNKDQNYICRNVTLNIANNQSIFTRGYKKSSQISIPIAHHDGNYFADEATIKSLQDDDRIAFTYHDNVNGSQANIAGVLNKNANVLGMMPHPERAIDIRHGGTDGLKLFRSLVRELA